ncbi:TTC4 [Cordylochernes scorpioides]|uniref:TTC4 n=1 Tax=Cordylochernes scorpioides TaxID=51811 RepID=A0ABY6KAD9_9ARAC|nr:TTC4 [Cordylochernes scorpioides]UYV64670.1 TTC4 [Cordylochernes scorpioides]
MGDEKVVIDKEKLYEDLVNHPIFWSEAPPENSEMHPCYEALQQLKYSEDINSPEELAQANKDEGNLKFKKKLFKYAIRCYTDGIEQKCSNDTLNAELYSNRAAANFHLENYGSAIKDLKQAKQLKPNYLKAILKGAQCYQKLDKADDCITWCNEGLNIEPNNIALQKLKEDAEIKLKKKKEQELEEAKKEEEEKKIIEALKERNLAWKGSIVPSTNDKMVKFDENGYLEWPVIFHFIECGQSYLVPNFNEYSIFKDHILLMLDSRQTIAEWIPDSYTPNNITTNFTLLKMDYQHFILLLKILQLNRDLNYYPNEWKKSEVIIIPKSELAKLVHLHALVETNNKPLNTF